MRIIFALLLIGGSALATEETTESRAPAAVANAKVTTNTAGTPVSRNYSGGRDEDDLKVQETLVPPMVKTDRHQIEAKVLKINVKNVNSDEQEATEQ